MKKLIAICTVLVFILSGCNINKSIETEAVKGLFAEIKNEYTFIEEGVMYSRVVLDRLVIEYSSSVEVEEKEVARCFEATRKWLIEEKNIKQIQNHLDQDIKALDIRFNFPNKEEIYIGRQDDEEKSDKDTEFFSKWQHEVVEKEEK